MSEENSRPAPDVDTDRFLRYLKSPAYKARQEFIDSFSLLPDLGIGHLSLQKAADLLTVDLWGSGDLEANVPESDNEVASTNDPVLMKALEPQRELILARLVESVVRGTLKPSKSVRDVLTGEIDPNETYAEYESLVGWLEEFGYLPGDWMSEYIDNEGKVHSDVVEALADIRILHSKAGSERERMLQSKRMQARLSLGPDGEPEYASMSMLELREVINGYAEEVAYLRHELGQRPAPGDDRPLQPKSRNTLYRLIAALCFAAKIDPSHRNAARTIEGFTQQAGLPVGDDTIRKILAELPEPEAG